MACLEGVCLVTGATGFLASHLIKDLLERGCHVRGTVRDIMDRAKVQPVRNLHPTADVELELIEATLEDRQSWRKAMEDVCWVFHTARPPPPDSLDDEMDVISSAANGTLNVLEAARDSSSVQRVVINSGSVAITAGHENSKTVLDESTHPDVHLAPPYTKSIVQAERVAWKFMESKPGFELVVMNPGLVLGPLLTPNTSAVVEDAIQLMNRDFVAVPKIFFNAIDVRDVAQAHIAAMLKPEARGRRFLLSSQDVWLQELAQIVDDEFLNQGYNVPTKAAPSFLLRAMSWCNSRLKYITPQLDKVVMLDTTMMRSMLEVHPRPVREAAIDMAYSLVELGLVRKTARYRGPGHTTRNQGMQTMSLDELPQPEQKDVKLSSVFMQQVEKVKSAVLPESSEKAKAHEPH